MHTRRTRVATSGIAVLILTSPAMTPAMAIGGVLNYSRDNIDFTDVAGNGKYSFRSNLQRDASPF